MPSFPGSNNALPGVYTLVETLSTGVSVPSGVRLAVLMGEGARRETIVASANGNGNDGLNSTFTTTTGSDGRHFQLSSAPVVTNRTTLYRNGITLTGLEDTIDGQPFSAQYDYRIDIETGNIELQRASLVDQGGSFWAPSTLNNGNGSIVSLQLVDENAPSEVWTIRAVTARRDGYGDVVDGYTQFIATGSVSGTLLDDNGNSITWQSNGTVVSNGVLQFGITDGTTPFIEGDRITVEVSGGILNAGESLTATYISETDINDPQFFTDLDSLTLKHGQPSLDNRLSLSAQLAFANQPPGVWAVQCAPSIPRRVSYILEDSASGNATLDDFVFPLDVGVTPDTDTKINFFVTDPDTGIEQQIIPNKVDFYNSDYASNPSDFVFGAEYEYSYTVILDDSVVKEGTDGYINPSVGDRAYFYSDSVAFDSDDAGLTRTIRIFNATNPDNNGTFAIVSVQDGYLTIDSGASPFVEETSVEFEILDSASQSARILFTQDLQLDSGEQLRATIVDVKDADFFDAGWVRAYEEIEKIDVDIVVPTPSQTISVIFQNGATHVQSMSNIKNRKERVLFIGAIQGLEPDNVIGTTSAAVEDIGVLEGIQGDDVNEILSGDIEDLANYGVQASFGGTYRVVYFYPDEIVVQVGGDREKVDGFYIASAAAGYLSGVPNIAVPLTNKNLSGFTILRDKLYRPITLEQLTASGITVLQPVQGGGKVIRGQTTTNSGFAEEREISIVFIRDRVAKVLRKGFEGFIGLVESPSLKSLLTTRAIALLQGFVNQGIVTQFKDLKVERDEVDPTQWNVTVKVQPAYPVNFIFIRVGVGLLE